MHHGVLQNYTTTYSDPNDPVPLVPSPETLVNGALSAFKNITEQRYMVFVTGG